MRRILRFGFLALGVAGLCEVALAEVATEITVIQGVDPAVSGGAMGQPSSAVGETEGFSGHFSSLAFSGIERHLCAAASDGDVNRVKRLLAAGANLEARSARPVARGMTPLMVGVWYGWDIGAIRLLLDVGANVNARDDRESSALIHAAERRPTVDPELVELLVLRGAEVDTSNSKGMTALMYASTQPDARVVRILLEAGSTVDARDARGWTALMHAGRRRGGDTRIVGMLIEAGADVNASHHYGGTPLSIAAYNCHPAVVELLLASGADMHAADKAGWNALICASIGDCEPAVELLLAAGADVNAKDRLGKSALTHATDRGRARIVQLLTETGIQRVGDWRDLP